jgi:hypothetical protein
VANPYKALRQNVEKESPQKLCGGKHHRSRFVAASIVSPAECDTLAVKGDQAMIGDGNAMSVASQITKDLLRTAESRLRVYHPIGPAQLTQEGSKQLWIGECCARSGTVELLSSVETLQPGDELATEHPTQDLDREEERIAGAYPSGAIGQKAACWYHA